MTHRRAFLKRTGIAFGVGAASSIAGCTETTNSTTGTATSTTTEPSYSAPAWSTDRGDLAHTASVNGNISTPLQKRWQVSVGGGVGGSPVGGHGYILVGADDGFLYALDPQDGSEAWSFDAGAAIATTPTAVSENKGQDKYVFVTAEDGNLYAVDGSDGTERWSVDGPEGTFVSSPTYAGSNVFYTYMDTGVSSKLRAVDASTGDIEWESDRFNITTATPMHAFGNIHLGIDQSGTVFKSFDAPSGELDWDVYVDGPDGSASMSGVADMAVEEGEPAIAYLSPDTSEIEGRTLGSGTVDHSQTLSEFGDIHGMALTQDPKKVLVVSQRRHVHALYPPNQVFHWTYSHDDNAVSSSNRQTAKPAIYDGHVFHVVGGDRLVSLSLSDGTEEWSADLDGTSYSSPCVGGSSVYVADTTGSVYAFSP